MQITEAPSAVQPLQHAATFIREGFVTLNPAQAGVILRECAYDGQRKVDKDHVAVLAEQMRRKSWLKRGGIDFARLNGRLILANGYHRLTSQIEAAVNIEWTVVIHECRAADEVRDLYHKFDTNVRKRTNIMVLNGIGFADEVGISKTAASALFGAAPIIATGLRSPHGNDKTRLFAQRLADDRLRISREYAPEAVALERLINPAAPALKRKLHLKGITAVALVTLREQPKVASEFWSGLAKNDGLRRGDPRHTFIQEIQSRAVNVGSANASIAMAAIAWNAFWQGRELKAIRIGSSRPFRLCGTTYTVAG